MDELRKWAEENYTNTEAFWAMFAMKICKEARDKDIKPYSDLYAEFEERGEEIKKRHAMEAWMK